MERLNEEQQHGATPLLICSQCREEKPQEQYYKKGSRIESCCKDCKKKNQREAYQKRNTNNQQLKKVDFAKADEPVETMGAELVPNRLTIEPENNFGIWEKKYNRKLTEEERIEIHSNLLALVKSLKEEYRIKTV